MKKISKVHHWVPAAICGVGAVLGGGQAFAQDNVLNKVEVTGSALRHIAAETALPV